MPLPLQTRSGGLQFCAAEPDWPRRSMGCATSTETPTGLVGKASIESVDPSSSWEITTSQATKRKSRMRFFSSEQGWSTIKNFLLETLFETLLYTSNDFWSRDFEQHPGASRRRNASNTTHSRAASHGVGALPGTSWPSSTSLCSESGLLQGGDERRGRSEHVLLGLLVLRVLNLCTWFERRHVLFGL